MTQEKSEQKKSKLWHFVVPLILQTGLILAVPAQSFYIYTTGKTVILQTQPVDPYDLLRGYSQTLSYQISSVNNLVKLKGWEEFKGIVTSYSEDNYYMPNNTVIYVTLESPSNSNQKPPLPWTPVAISRNYPQGLKSNQIVIKGVTEYSFIRYGLESYFFPESEREEINKTIGEIQSQNQGNQEFVVEIKIDQQGNAVPISLWIKDKNYKF